MPPSPSTTVAHPGRWTMAQEKENQGDMTVQQAGHMGGEKTKQEVQSGELPKDFYSEIGHKGGQKVKELIEKGEQTEGTENP
jgi:general stress protein YciG